MMGNCRVLDMGLLSIVKVGFIEEVPFPVSEWSLEWNIDQITILESRRQVIVVRVA